jgi:hypothetical protein
LAILASSRRRRVLAVRNEMTWPIRRTSGAGTGVKDGPRLISAYHDPNTTGNMFSSERIRLAGFDPCGSARAPEAEFNRDRRTPWTLMTSRDL